MFLPRTFEKVRAVAPDQVSWRVMVAVCLLLVFWAGCGEARAAQVIELPGTVAGVRAHPFWNWRDQFKLGLEGVVTWGAADGKQLVLQDETGALAMVAPEGFGAIEQGQRIRLSATNAHPHLVSAPGFPHQPDSRVVLRDFEIPADSGTQFVDRVSGYVIAPRSGEYRFSIAADDTAELWLGTEKPWGERRVACIEVYTEPRDWRKMAQQKSEPIWLEKGRPYYIEAVHDQGLGNSHLSVAWEGPGLPLQLVGGEYLRPAREPGSTEQSILASSERGVLREVWQWAVLQGAWVMASGGVLETSLAVAGVKVDSLGKRPMPAVQRVYPAQKLGAAERYRWSEVEGNVPFAAIDQGVFLLDLEDGGKHMRVEVQSWQEGDLLRVRERRVRVRGVAEPRMDREGNQILGNLKVTSAASIEVLDLEPSVETARLSIVDVIEDRSVGARGRQVRLSGRVIEKASATELVLSDEGSFSAFASLDGKLWTAIGKSVEVPMGDTFLAGLAVSSRSENALATAVFEMEDGVLEKSILRGIGQAADRGELRRVPGALTLKGRGREIWRGPDQFSYVSVAEKGDLELTVRIASFQAKDSWSKAGLLMRSSDDPNGGQAGLLHAEAGGACFQYRGGLLGATPVSVSDTRFKPPYWMRLRRRHTKLRVYLDSPYKVEVGGRVSVTGYVRESVQGRSMDHAVCTVARSEEEGGMVQGLEPHSVLEIAQMVTGKASLSASAHDVFRIRGVVTFCGESGGQQRIAVQDESAGAFLVPVEGLSVPFLQVGQGVEAQCRATPAGGSSVLFVEKIWSLGDRVEPQPLRHPLESFLPRRGDGVWIETEGVVRAVTERGVVKLKANGEMMSLELPPEGLKQMAGMVDASVRVRGVSSTPGEQERRLLVPSMRYIQTMESPSTDLSGMPVQKVMSVRQETQLNPSLHRVKIRGQVSHVSPGYVQMEDETGSFRAVLADQRGAQVSDEIELVGFPEMGSDKVLVLAEAVCLNLRAGKPLEAHRLKPGEPVAEQFNGRLVRFQAVLLQDKVQEEARSMELSFGKTVVYAWHKGAGMNWEAQPEGSLVEVQGIWLEGNEEMDGVRPMSEESRVARLLLRGEADVLSVQTPKWWVLKRTLLFSSIGVLGVFIASLWIVVLRRRVAQRTAELQATMEKLRQETQAAATLAERNRLAGEIHDSLEQGFSALVFQLDATAKLASCPVEIRSALGLARSMVAFSRTELKHAVWDLESPILENADLGTALGLVAAQHGQEQPRITIEVTGTRRRLTQALEHHVLRMAQEALANAVKHAGASKVEVRIEFLDTALVVELRDDGCGFEPGRVLTGGPGHFGLRGLRSRARKIGGELGIRSAPGKGTTISLRVPLAGADRESAG